MRTSLATEFPNDNPLLDSGAARCRARPVRRRMIAVMPYLLVPEGAVLPPALAAEVAAHAEAPRQPVNDTSPPAAEVPVATAPAEPAAEPASSEPFERFIRALVSVAAASGATRAAAVLPELLLEGRLGGGLTDEALAGLRASGISRDGSSASAEFMATARAWQGVLGGSSGDLGACGSSTLDTWAAELVCALSGSPSSRVGDYRRELRRRGVAAFGLIDV